MKPKVLKHGTCWTVRINGTLFGAYATFERAYELAWNAATHASRARFKRDLARAREAMDRLEAR